MENNIILGIVSVLALVGGVLVARRGSAADLVAAATGLIAPLTTEITKLKERVAALEPLVPQVAALQLWGAYLEKEVVRLGGTPLPFEEFLRRVEHGQHPLP
jgi:hypothetical protein